MSIADRIADKIAGAFGALLLRELRRLTVAVEKGIDSHREIYGLQPIFAVGKSSVEIAIEAEQLEAKDQRDLVEGVDQDAAPDFVRLEILEMLARDHQVMVTPETDLIALGKARGWLDASGGITMLPKNYLD